MKVKKEHLFGEISDFPLHVVQIMVAEQVRQGNRADPSVFANCDNATRAKGGFDWDKTNEGVGFWSDVINLERFDLIPLPEGFYDTIEEPEGHIHVESMKKYAKDAETSKTPWKNWEFCYEDSGHWLSLYTHPSWDKTVQYRRKSEIFKSKDESKPTPNEIVRAMLAKGMIVWASVSDCSYNTARKRMSTYLQRITDYNYEHTDFPIRVLGTSWKYAIPVDLKTMTEITKVPQ